MIKASIPELIKSNVSDYANQYRQYLTRYFGLRNEPNDFLEVKLGIKSAKFSRTIEPTILVGIGNGATDQVNELDLIENDKTGNLAIIETSEKLPDDESESNLRDLRNILPLLYVKGYPLNKPEYGLPVETFINSEYYNAFHLKKTDVAINTIGSSTGLHTEFNVTGIISPEEIVATTSLNGGLKNLTGVINEIALYFAIPIDKPVKDRIINGRPVMYRTYERVIPFYRYTFKDIAVKDLKPKSLEFSFTFGA